MSTTAAGPATSPGPPAGSRLGRVAWHWRNNPKRELWFAWYTTVIFYNIFFIVFFPVTHAQPPPHPYWSDAQVAYWFSHNHDGLLIGFAIIFAIAGMTVAQNALIAYSMRRMSVSRAFGYSYLVMYSLSAVPGLLLLCVVLSVGAMRPGRDPAQLHWLYDLAFLSYTGTMGIFLVGSLVWMLAILLDKNRVLPKWFGYLNLCNALTEVVVAPAWIFHQGVLDWNGLISWWVNMVVFGIYTGAFITLLRNLILREDFGDGPLPDLKKDDQAGQPPGEGAEKPARAVPGQPDMWVLVLFEALVFTAYFAVYLFHRSAHSELFLRSQAELNPWLGTLDTLLLLTSSLFMLRCVQASRAGAFRAAMSRACTAALLGMAFLASKITEWALLVHGGHGFTSNEFFTYYFFLTGIHLLHLLIGFITIGVIIYQLRRREHRSQEIVETCATYWHTVDLLWVLIFSLLYVVR